VKWNDEPWPTALSTQILPPCISTICLTIEAEASPESIARRHLDPPKRSNTCPISSGGMPRPVSVDADQRETSLDLAGEGHEPSVGRVLDRVVDDVADHLDQAVAVAGHDRQPGIEVGLNSTLLALGAAREIASMSTSLMSTSPLRIDIRPDSMRSRSSMSLIRRLTLWRR
jgi:hypothetical protein